MARRFLVPIDGSGLELRNVRFQSLTADPNPAVSGIYLNSPSGKLRYYDGTGWAELGLASLDSEGVQDVVGAMAADSATVNVTYDDTAGSLVFTVLDSPTVAGQTPANLRDRTTHTGLQPLGTVTGHDKAAHDALLIDAATLEGSDLAAVTTAVQAALVDGSPATLDTLNELAAALGDDPNFAATISTDIGDLETRVAAIEALPTSTRKVAATIGDGTALAFVVPHGFGTRDVSVSVYSTGAPYDEPIIEPEHTDLNNITIRTATPLAANSLRVVIIG